MIRRISFLFWLVASGALFGQAFDIRCGPVETHQIMVPERVEWKTALGILGTQFSVLAPVDYAIPSGKRCRLTFIQQINSDATRFDYANSLYHWTLPRYPYCDCSPRLVKKGHFWISEGVRLKGSGHVVVRMEDNPQGSYSWGDIPPPNSGVPRGSLDLQGVSRKQTFTVWLVAIDEQTGTVQLMKRIDWGFSFVCRVDTQAELGKRSALISSGYPDAKISDPGPDALETMLRNGVLSGQQCANRDQQLWWTSKQTGAAMVETVPVQ